MQFKLSLVNLLAPLSILSGLTTAAPVDSNAVVSATLTTRTDVGGTPTRDVAPRSTTSSSSLTDIVIYAGSAFLSMYTETLDGILDTETDILYMADQIGVMADRIVYVTEISEDGAIEVIYLAAALISEGESDGSYLYKAMLVPVAALPTGW